MGNQQAREAREAREGVADAQGATASASAPLPSNQQCHSEQAGQQQQQQNQQQQQEQQPSTRARTRFSRAELFGLGLGHVSSSSSSRQETAQSGNTGRPDREPAEEEPFRHKETRQEREARKRERERIARVKERERSVQEEGIDGGFLVTLGTYTGPEDFSKPVVRHLQIERRLAPFWKGLGDHEDTWTDWQLIAAVRGLSIPSPDEPLPPDLLKPASTASSASAAVSAELQPSSNPNLGSSQSLLPPRQQNHHSHGPAAPQSTAAVPTTASAGAGAASSSSSSSASAAPPALKTPRGARALAAALSLAASRSVSDTDVIGSPPPPRETTLPVDLTVDGRPIELALYRSVLECPICFLNYPPFLNYTRCCSQPICSECFVQIRRADPHLPEHHGVVAVDENGSEDGPSAIFHEQQLVSEPSMCPYCQQTELGVTYEPPPFRRGVVYPPSQKDALLGRTRPAATSQASLLSNPLSNPSSPMAPPPAHAQAPIPVRRRTQSLSADAPNVITTDRIRPDWSAKLLTAQQHRNRRAAAATALHTAAFNPPHQRAFVGRLGLFRRPTSQLGDQSQNQQSTTGSGTGTTTTATATHRLGPGLPDLEQLMVEEAIRRSLVAQDDQIRRDVKRKEKEQKQKQKEDEKKEKELRRALKQQQQREGGGLYGSGSGNGNGSGSASASASRSSLSLPFGRRRGNSASASSSLRLETAPAGSMSESEDGPTMTSDEASKGKGVDRLSAPAHNRQISNGSSGGGDTNTDPLLCNHRPGEATTPRLGTENSDNAPSSAGSGEGHGDQGLRIEGSLATLRPTASSTTAGSPNPAAMSAAPEPDADKIMGTSTVVERSDRVITH